MEDTKIMQPESSKMMGLGCCCDTSGPNPDIEVGSDVDFDADDLQSQFGCCLGSARLWAISFFFQ